MTKTMERIETNRTLLGKKTRYATYIREDILGIAKECASKGGIPITRVIENSLLLYIEMDGLSDHIIRHSDKARSLDEVCDMIANRVINESR